MEPCVQDHDPNIITSSLSRTVTVDGVTVEVRIFRLEQDQHWLLEVVNEFGNSTVWDDVFETDKAASAAFEVALAHEGIETFLDGGDAPTLH
jgi:hypothetical protein